MGSNTTYCGYWSKVDTPLRAIVLASRFLAEIVQQTKAGSDDDQDRYGDDRYFHQLHDTGVTGFFHGKPCREERLQIMDLLHGMPANDGNQQKADRDGGKENSLSNPYHVRLLDKEMDRVLQPLLEFLPEAAGLRPAPHAPVHRQRRFHHRGDPDLPSGCDRTRGHRPDREDGGFRRVDDRDEFLHV